MRRRPGCGGVRGAPPRDRVRLPAALPPRDGDLARPHSPRDWRPHCPDATASRRRRGHLTGKTTLQPRCCPIWRRPGDHATAAPVGDPVASALPRREDGPMDAALL